MTANMWEYGHGQDDWASDRLIGYKVEAVDGSIGKIDKTSAETGANTLVVDTGPWIFGQKVMLPAGLIQRVDHDSEKVFVGTDKDQVKNSPEYREDSADSSVYRQSLGDYYGRSTGR
jgi:hypothetical protein